MTSNDLALPCVLCLAKDQGHSDYKDADLTPSMVHTKLKTRLRQHFQRDHNFKGARDPAAEGLKSHAKLLLCRRLHAQKTQFESPPEFQSSVSHVY